MSRRIRFLLAHPVDAAVVLGWMSAVEVAVRVLPLPRLASLIGSPLGIADPPRELAAPPELRGSERRRLLLLDALGRRWPFGSGPCLRQALVAGRILRRHRPVLRIGAALSHSDVVGHAWLEVGALELGHSEDFTALVVAPGP